MAFLGACLGVGEGEGEVCLVSEMRVWHVTWREREDDRHQVEQEAEEEEGA